MTVWHGKFITVIYGQQIRVLLLRKQTKNYEYDETADAKSKK